MDDLFNAFLMGVIVVLILMLVNITGRGFYHDLQRQGQDNSARHVPVASGHLSDGDLRAVR